VRVLLDTNVLISYLLIRRVGTPIEHVVEAALEGRYTLLLPAGVVAELSVKVATKPYLAERVDQEAVERLVAGLSVVGEIVPPSSTRGVSDIRDPKDRFLLRAAWDGRADVLGTGDRDLLILADEAAPPRIVTPAEFAAELADARNPPGGVP
jgi:putative PIN family toxin of toxin-antitoxin system